MYKNNNFSKKISPVLCGNVLEAYDFYLYGILAPVFSKVFFPANFEYSLLGAFFLFAAAYFARPFGSIFWGHIADSYGRRPVLLWTLSLMATSSLGMVFMPSYESIGYTCCILVLMLRFVQGITFGGEFPTAMVTLYEMAPDGRKTVFTSLAECFAVAGTFIALLGIVLLLYLMGSEAFHSYGWRILFALSVVFILIIAYIRRNLIETKVQCASDKSIKPFSIAAKNWRIFIRLVLFLLGVNVLAFSYSFYFPVFIQNSTSSGLTDLQRYAMHGAMVFYLLLLLPVAGCLGDFIGKYKFAQYSIIMAIVLSFPLYYMALSQNIFYIIVCILFFGLLVASVVGVALAIVISQTHQNSRVTMTGIAHGTAIILFGATTPMVNEFLTKQFNNELMPAYIMAFSLLISLAALKLMEKEV